MMHLFIGYLVVGFFVAVAFAMEMPDKPNETTALKFMAFFMMWAIWPSMIIRKFL